MIASLRDADRDAWKLVARRAAHGFMQHRGIDSAAALTFFAALSLFPAALTVVSAFSLGAGRTDAVDDLLDAIGGMTTESAVAAIAEPLRQLTSIPNAGLALGIGIALLIWTASAYATAFGRAVNSVYEVQEGRPFWKFRGLMIVVTIVISIGFAAVAGILLLTGPVVEAIGREVGFGEPWITLWSILKWPVLLAFAVVIVGVLYYTTPNIARPRIRWVSWGAVFAIVVWAIATVGFGIYVSTIGQYDEVYGWLGGGIVLLLWLYITNLVLVVGAEVDAETTRLRQLESGIAAEELIHLPARDTRRNHQIARQRDADVRDSRALREHAELRRAARADTER